MKGSGKKNFIELRKFGNESEKERKKERKKNFNRWRKESKAKIRFSTFKEMVIFFKYLG
jgi:hypothetical protein